MRESEIYIECVYRRQKLGYPFCPRGSSHCTANCSNHWLPTQFRPVIPARRRGQRFKGPRFRGRRAGTSYLKCVGSTASLSGHTARTNLDDHQIPALSGKDGQFTTAQLLVTLSSTRQRRRKAIRRVKRSLPHVGRPLNPSAARSGHHVYERLSSRYGVSAAYGRREEEWINHLSSYPGRELL